MVSYPSVNQILVPILFVMADRTMYDFPDSTDIFEIFEVGFANSHIFVINQLATTNLAIFEHWRPDWQSGGRQIANLALFVNVLLYVC